MQCNIYQERSLTWPPRKNFFLPNLTGEINRYIRASLVVQSVKNPPAMQETQVPSMGQGRSPGEGNGNPFQYSWLENFMARAAWWAIVHEVTRVGHDLATKPPPPWVQKCLYIDKRFISSNKDILEVEQRDHTFFLFLYFFFFVFVFFFLYSRRSVRRHLCWNLRQK